MRCMMIFFGVSAMPEVTMPIKIYMKHLGRKGMFCWNG